MLPYGSPRGDMQKRSIIDAADIDMFTDSVSEEDSIALHKI